MRTLQRYYSFIFRHPWSFASGMVLLVFSLVLANATPFFAKWLTEAVQANQLERVLQLILALGGVLIVANLLDTGSSILTDRSAAQTSTLIAQAVLRHIHNLDFAYHTSKSSGKLISLMKRGDEAFFTYFDILNRSLFNIGIGFVVMIGAFSQLPGPYILFVLGLIGLSLVISIFLIKINIAKRVLFNEADDDVSAARVDNLVNFDTVKYFANERFEQARFAELMGTWQQTLLAYFYTFRYFDLILGNIINLALVGILVLAWNDLRAQTITLADFLLIFTFAMSLFPKMMYLLFNLRELAKKNTDLNNYFNLLDEKIQVEDPLSPAAASSGIGDVMFEHVTFSYGDKKTPVLQDFSLHIKSGEAVALVGYSGAGKTTIAKLLMRMYDTTSGTIRLDGVKLPDLAKEALRKRIGIVPQDPLLFNNTVYYNIAYARAEASREEVLAAAKAARVTEFVKALPDGFETVVGERGIKLSGGQRQRLAIARVLLKQPEVLIFDEATSALDSASERLIQAAFWEMVRDKKQPRTAIIIAHRLSTIMKADRIVVLDQGKIVEIGTHDSLLAKKTGIYHSLWSLQRDGFIGDGETAG